MSNYKTIFKEFDEISYTPQYRQKLREAIEFREMIDKNFQAKHQQVHFALHTTSDAVKKAYKRMLNNHNSDYTIEDNG